MDGIFKNSLIVFFLLSLMACEVQEKKTEKELPYAGDRLVVYGFVYSGSRIEVTVKRTLPLTCVSCDDTISGVRVLLYENDQYLCDLVSANGIQFFSPDTIIPNTDRLYKIEVTAPDLPSARSDVINPIDAIVLDSISIGFSDSYTSLNFSFYKNDPGVGSYFYSLILQKKNGEKIKIYPFYLGYHSLFDVADTGLIHRNFNFQMYRPEASRLFFTLYRADTQLVKYLKSLYDYESTFDDPYFDNPSLIYSNITGGYGIFASMAADSCEVVLR
ncbi:MAG: DUF4249 family protein [Bacteroidales bacterium]